MSEYFLPAHLIILGVTVIGILLADHEAYAWLTGKKPILEYKKMLRLHLWVGGGLIGMIVTGGLMAWPMRDYLLHNSPAFLGKMFFVALLIGNSFVIGEILKLCTTRTFASLSKKERAPIYISGAVSTLSWVCAALLALFIFP